MRNLLCAALFTSLCASCLCAQTASSHPRDKEIHDADTLAWWHTTEALSNDSMEGRDTGSAAYQRAAEYVAARFKAAGLQPAGEDGYFQSVPMHQVELTASTAKVWVLYGEGNSHSIELAFLREVTVTVAPDLPVDTTVAGGLVFRGYCGKDQMADVAGKMVLCFGTQRAGLPSAGDRGANLRAAGALGVVTIDDPYFTIEPPRWPFAYARSVTLKSGEAGRPATRPFLSLRISAGAFHKLLAGTGHDADAIL